MTGRMQRSAGPIVVGLDGAEASLAAVRWAAQASPRPGCIWSLSSSGTGRRRIRARRGLTAVLTAGRCSPPYRSKRPGP